MDRAEPREISRAVDEDGRSPEALHELGLRRLADGQYREALLTFESLSLRPASEANSLSDLAAAYLERGRAERRPFDSILALSAANRALAAQPARAEALFNRAEALSRLQTGSRDVRVAASACWRPARESRSSRAPPPRAGSISPT